MLYEVHEVHEVHEVRDVLNTMDDAFYAQIWNLMAEFASLRVPSYS